MSIKVTANIYSSWPKVRMLPWKLNEKVGQMNAGANVFGKNLKSA